jgi:acetoin utilization protein AcuB
MRVRHIMSTPVVTVPSNTPVLEAAKIMKERHIERLPVVDKDKLKGIVTKDGVLRSSPSAATSLSIWEIQYLYAKLTVKDIMQKDVATVTPDTTIENAVRYAQERRVGALPVIDDGKVVGIVTTNDFFYMILNPILGIGEEGSRIIVRHCETTQEIAAAFQCVADNGFHVVNVSYFKSRRGEERDLIIHVREEETSRLADCMRTQCHLQAEAQER